MKKIFLTMALAIGLIASAQVKIGANPTTIDANSLLELETTNQGLLYPRVALVSTDSYNPLVAVNPLTLLVEKQKGMTVYNTATTITGTSDVTPGLYVNDGTNWVKITPKTLYSDDAAITSARTVTLNNNDLTFTAGVSGTGKTVVASTFKTGGAVYGNYRVVTTQLNTAAWLDTDYAIIATVAGAFNLPKASDFVGRIISLTNQTGGPGSYGGTDALYKPTNASTLGAGKGHLIIATSTGWHIIGG
jgi:hypothetical protein